MRQFVGFVLLHLALLGTGLTALRAVGLIDVPACAWRGWLPALGPGLLTGITLVMPCLIVGLVLGVPLTVATTALCCGGWVLVSVVLGARRSRVRRSPQSGSARSAAQGYGGSAIGTRVGNAVVVLVGAYAVLGALALARVPTRGDDARIWSLKGLTLSYYGRLQPEIFLNPLQAGAHPVYPLFQPVLEAVLSRAMGYPELRLYHTELWLLFGAALWTAGYLLVATGSPGRVTGRIVSMAPLAALALVPIAITNIVVGDADITGSILLAVGTLAFGLWLDTDDGGCLSLAAVLLTAAASTKDEDLLAVLCVLLIGCIATLVRARVRPGAAKRRLASLLGVGGYLALLVLPWRVWAAQHHLTDSVQPHLSQALDPFWLIHRTHQLHETAAAMIAQVMQNWNWLGAIFLVACLGCLATRTLRRVVAFYLASAGLIVAALLWLYTSTPLSLAFLLPTSMDRTVGVFMTLATVATAHLVYRLVNPVHAAPVTPDGAQACPGDTGGVSGQ
jgi:hypothetical protein